MLYMYVFFFQFHVPEDVTRYQVPEEAVNITQPSDPPSNATRLYDVELVTEPQIGVRVRRRSTGAIVYARYPP